MDLEDLYQEILLDHSRYPRNFGKPEGQYLEAEGTNPSCGDTIQLFISINDSNQIIERVQFLGRGCAISIASASLMTEIVQSKKVEEVIGIKNTLQLFLTSKETVDDSVLGELSCLKGVRHFPARVKCALLPWHALAKVIQ
ncbi:SUF system NifU family Fe-S cluster assembly protein [Candidatus Methylacidiphilum fumarolicum]|uniref:NifU-like protein involved in Fe-S cluster formation n=2 Tax=Candidatus Methylacidiphilum fumarolicum TaxID=591154 RepID=I0JXY9_METFB|nr:SUF system NifU family Fe-S cluster assembly protein [Candidatus Methylacidiphilum fumarolicum]MBW6414153.1 SUF system NifU family Fe-S cluster assembly protein [Candidatus Methylacidiphilum fumarolicum]TFE70009.1 SUF system NifU family Fe-S cluster assembly protein [Candidatus Methylacidiphilum fumarolicum]TFE73813.1 SUF system NifU family Fe-S cluster assembly protein [Candidatus Methylacidiphilum fumarolicum]TFE75581.1 SUF system NifU family Fe-S cluster assembly protein [Candidatus Methy